MKYQKRKKIKKITELPIKYMGSPAFGDYVNVTFQQASLEILKSKLNEIIDVLNKDE